MTKKIIRVLGFTLVIGVIAVSVSTILYVYNCKKHDRPYSAKLVYEYIDRSDEIG